MKLAILTGGGDCPGMNAFIRSVARSAWNLLPECEVWGVLDGWRGLLEKSYRRLEPVDTAGISALGGTILGTLRMPSLRTNAEERRAIAENFIAGEFDALCVCGGNGSLAAACDLNDTLHTFDQHRPVLFTAASIDNDVANIYGTSLGFYSAIDRSLEMLGWIRDTASAHRRVYIIGSMGRRSAWLPFYAGIAAGAEYVIRPDEHVDFEAIADMIDTRERDTRIIVSEAYPKTLEEIKAIVENALERRRSEHEIRTVDMGYFQRGGGASVSDVLRADWLGFHMVRGLLEEECASSLFGAFNIGTPPNRVPLAEALRPEANYDDIPREVVEMALALR